MSFIVPDVRSECCDALIVYRKAEHGCLHFMEPQLRYACYRCDREVPRKRILGGCIAEFHTTTIPRFMEPSFVQAPVSLASLLTSVQPMKADPD